MVTEGILGLAPFKVAGPAVSPPPASLCAGSERDGIHRLPLMLTPLNRPPAPGLGPMHRALEELSPERETQSPCLHSLPSPLLGLAGEQPPLEGPGTGTACGGGEGVPPNPGPDSWGSGEGGAGRNWKQGRLTCVSSGFPFWAAWGSPDIGPWSEGAPAGGKCASVLQDPRDYGTKSCLGETLF